VDHRSFRDQLAFSIGFVVSSNHVLLRRMLKEQTSDDARAQLDELVIGHLELSGFVIDEEHQVLRKRPPIPNHGQDAAAAPPAQPRAPSARPWRAVAPQRAVWVFKGMDLLSKDIHYVVIFTFLAACAASSDQMTSSEIEAFKH
jgi:hypothetical protein